jgi:hypothetical protein
MNDLSKIQEDYIKFLRESNSSDFAKFRFMSLAKEIFSAGVRCGYERGLSDANGYHFGSGNRCIVNPEEVWKDEVEYYINVEYQDPFDINDPEQWKNIP